MELDPLFVRGLRLLQSRGPDSLDQLRSLFEEVKVKCSRPGVGSGSGGKNSPANSSPRSTPLQIRPSDLPQKRTFSKYREDSSDSSGAKRAHLDGSHDATRSFPSSPSFSRCSDDLNDTAGLEMDFMDQLSCVVCCNIGVTVGNQLKECSVCGALYHQDCHRPAITDAEHSDTRAIWKCYKCRSSASASTTSKVPVKTSSSSSSLGSRSSSYSSSTSRLDRIKSDSTLAKKNKTLSLASISNKTGSVRSSSSTTSSSVSSLARSSTGGGSTSGASAPPPNSMVSAERRMQLMKKKAAAKLNEKRKN